VQGFLTELDLPTEVVALELQEMAMWQSLQLEQAMGA
jgi:hypothetical protein